MVVGIKERFDIVSPDVVRHPFIVAMVLDPEYKAMENFPAEIRSMAYDNVRTLAATMPQPLPSPASDSESAESPAKRQNDDDSRKAARRFLGTTRTSTRDTV
jgi:hypothetical protein